MLDRFDRQINYLRISVTDRCNLRCVYCMPSEGIQLLKHTDILTFDEITSFCKVAVSHGITKVRLTGGEPLVRKGISALVRMLADLNGISDLSMTTNGILLREHADELKSAGLHRVNISLDTVNPDKFREISRGGEIKMVFEGINAALDAGLTPVKINCVVRKSDDEPDAREVAEFCSKKGLEIRYIRQMDLVRGHFSTVIGGTGGDCAHCNRLRITANGILKPCLFSDLEFDIRKLGAEQAFMKAIELKPDCGSVNSKSAFYNIGG